MVVEPAAARQALGGAPAGAGLASLVAAAAAAGCRVPKVAQGAHAHALPVGADWERTFLLAPAPRLPSSTRVRPRQGSWLGGKP